MLRVQPSPPASSSPAACPIFTTIFDAVKHPAPAHGSTRPSTTGCVPVRMPIAPPARRRLFSTFCSLPFHPCRRSYAASPVQNRLVRHTLQIEIERRINLQPRAMRFFRAILLLQLPPHFFHKVRSLAIRRRLKLQPQRSIAFASSACAAVIFLSCSISLSTRFRRFSARSGCRTGEYSSGPFGNPPASPPPAASDRAHVC